MKLVIVGQGYVGLPLAQGAAGAGIQVVGLDLNQKTVDALNSGRSHVDDVSDADIAVMLGQGYVATSDGAVMAEADVIVICVPTPLREGVPDLTAVEGAADMIATHLTPGTLVVLESTTYPGTTQDLILPKLTASGLELDRDFSLAFSPERIDPGNEVYQLKNTPKVVGGVTPASTRRASEFYARFIDTVVETSGAREAETAKLLENTYRHVNIALVNEMAKFCAELGVDIWEVIAAASTKPFGFEAFYPGPGVGGHCIPIDPKYLSYEVERSLGYPFRFVELALEINNSMPKYIVDRVQDALNDASKPLKGSSVLLLGVAYKANIADQRESPALPIGEILRDKGANVSFHDPKIARWRLAGTELDRVADLDAAIESADIVVLLQANRSYDANALAAAAKLLFDTRGKASPASSAIRL
ncbi:nucleotide sugar dehydrogenase [Pseudoclavibacter helvolus]|uniref:nucleotide sugar dehydrogenase n=1 Tax=Pseudoclavibacter helvolus TaxID=255205 RepID=UPI0024ADD75F|nr:nucleotide sugar dehydrogenase [Pseudoclavibacter helvolus]